MDTASKRISFRPQALLKINKIEAIIRHHLLERTLAALAQIGVTDVNFTEVRGFGRQGGKVDTYRGAEYAIDFVPKVKIEFQVMAEATQHAIDAIIATTRTGRIGDGKIFITRGEVAVVAEQTLRESA